MSKWTRSKNLIPSSSQTSEEAVNRGCAEAAGRSMYNNGGGGGGRQHWQNANNPNMAPLPIRPRPGLGAGPSGPPPGMTPMMAGPPPMMQPPGPGMMGRPPPMMMGSEMPLGPMPSEAGGIPAHTTLFVGNISLGVTDPWMYDLLSVSNYLGVSTT